MGSVAIPAKMAELFKLAGTGIVPVSDVVMLAGSLSTGLGALSALTMVWSKVASFLTEIK